MKRRALQIQGKAKAILVLAVVLFVFGLAATTGSYQGWIKTVGMISLLISAGVATLLNLSRGFLDESNLTEGEREWVRAFEKPRRPIVTWEVTLYGVTIVLFGAILLSAVFGGYYDALTYSFGVALFASVITLVARRIF